MENIRPKQVVLWGAWYGSHNVGDQVLLLTITELLAKVLDESLRFTVLTSNPENLLDYTRRDSPLSIHPLHNKRQFHKIMHAIASCDLFVFGGGVPFYDQPYHLAVMAALVGIARTARTPYMLWAVSSQPIQRRTAKHLFKWVGGGAQAITCRDHTTQQLLIDCGVAKPISMAADPGFWLESAGDGPAWELIHRAGYIKRDRPLVALTPRTLRGPNGDAETHYQVKTTAQYQQEITCYAAALDWLWEQGYQPIFIPMNIVEPDDDRTASRAVIESARHGMHALLVDEVIFPRVAPSIYRQCSFSMVSRVHGGITSMIGNCPPIMYAFDQKHPGIMEAMDLTDYILPEASATTSSTEALLSRMAAQVEFVRAGMPRRLQELRQEALIPAELAVRIMRKKWDG